MELKIVNESGLREALVGMKFSFQPECGIGDIDISHQSTINSYLETAKKLCKRDGGHNKFIEQIQVWMIIRAPLYWWKQFDTYRVGTSKLSKSTMHTLMKEDLVDSDFEQGSLEGTYSDCGVMSVLNSIREEGDFDGLNKILPQAFLQTRMVNTNYKVLRNIILQRKGHKLPEWEYFIEEMFKQLGNHELLGIKYPFNFVTLDKGE